MEDKPLRAKVMNAIKWQSTGTIFIQIISWASTIIVIRLLTPSDYGLLGMAFPLLFFLQMISTWGFGSAIIQCKDLDKTKIQQLFGFIVLSLTFSFVLIYLTAPFIGSFFNEMRLVPIIRLLGVNLFLMGFYVIPDALLFRDMDFKTKTKVEIVSRLGAAIVAPICAFNSLGVWSLVFAEISLNLIRALGFNMFCRQWYKPVFQFTECRDLIKFSIKITGVNFVDYILNQADKVIVGKFLGKHILGIYGVAFNLALLPKEKIMPIVTQISYSAYSQIQEDIARINLNLLKTIGIVSFISFPLFWGMASVAAEGVPLILGTNWVQAAIPFQCLCIVIPLLSISPIFPSALNAIGRPDVVLTNSIIVACMMVTAILIGARFGLMWVCISWVSIYPIAFIVTSQKALKILGIGFKDFLKCMKFPMIASFMMFLSVLLIKRLFAGSLSQLLLLVVSSIAGMTIFGLLVLMFKKEQIMNLKDTILKNQVKTIDSV